MANPNPTIHHKRAFKQGWNDALKAKQKTRNRYRNPFKDTWMAIGFRFGDQLGISDEQLFKNAWNWSVKEYKVNGRAEPEKFVQESGDDSLRQSSEIEANIRTGAGFSYAKENREIERAAVSFVSKWYEEQGWQIKSVESQKRGYDLICSKGSTMQCVEVKGIRGTLQAFIITESEVRQAKTNRDFVICIVTSALSKQPKLARYPGSRLINDFVFAPLAYRASLK